MAIAAYDMLKKYIYKHLILQDFIRFIRSHCTHLFSISDSMSLASFTLFLGSSVFANLSIKYGRLSFLFLYKFRFFFLDLVWI